MKFYEFFFEIDGDTSTRHSLPAAGATQQATGKKNKKTKKLKLKFFDVWNNTSN